MKILWFLDKELDTATNKSRVLEVMKYFQREHEIHLVTGYRNEKIQFDELENEIRYIDSVKVPVMNRVITYFNQVNRFDSIVREREPDILLFNTSNYWLLKRAEQKRAELGYKLILDIRTLPVQSGAVSNRIDTYLFKKNLQFASETFDGVTYITEEMRRYCTEEYHLPEHESVIWSSGVDTDLFRPINGKVSDNRSFTLIYHGTLADNRGLDNLVRALSLIDEEVHLMLLGSGNGEENLKHLVEELSLDQRVTFFPPVPYREVMEFINQADVGVLPFRNWPAWNTSSPIKLFEYLASGMPVIVTKIPAHLNVLDNEPFAFWAENQSPRTLARTIEETMRNSVSLRGLGTKARKFALEHFTWAHQIQKFEQYLLRLLENA